MPKESTINSAQKASIELDKFIFHLIIVDNDMPTYLDEVSLTEEQKSFFKQRISEVAEGTQYEFIDKEHNSLNKECKKLLTDNTSFVEMSKNICMSFRTHHSGNMTDGAFVISTFNILNDERNVELIALIKMDQRKVLEYELEDTPSGRVAKMREIADSFIESKDAVQKVAIIDVTNTFKWDILAKERKKAEGIAEYFKKFLNAQMIDTPSKLTIKAVSEVNKWTKLNIESVKSIPEIVSLTSDPASFFKTKAVNFMKNNEGYSFNSDNFISNLVTIENLSNESKDKIDNLSKSLKEHLTTTGIYGQVFMPRPNSLPKSTIKTKKVTEEGVIIEWQGNPEDKGVKISKENTQTIVIIKTGHLEDIEK